MGFDKGETTTKTPQNNNSKLNKQRQTKKNPFIVQSWGLISMEMSQY